MADLTLLIERLARAKVEFVVVGGLAVMMYGTGLITKDVDVCVTFTSENLQRIWTALGDLHPYHRMTPQKVRLVLTPGFEKGLKNLYLMTDLGSIDLLGEVLGVGDYAATYAGSVAVPMPYGEYRLLSLDTLIAAKEAMNREKDRAAVRLLRGIRDAAG
jgi:hypothetical protein